MSRQGGQAAVLALVFVLLGILVLGLVIDLGLLSMQRSRLDHATEAAARAVARACRGETMATAGADCPAKTAERYLHANLPDAQVEDVRVEAGGRVTVGASLVVEHPFAVLWHAAPSRLVAQSSAKFP